MSDRDYKFQVSDKIQDAIFLARADTVDEVVSQLAELRLAYMESRQMTAPASTVITQPAQQYERAMQTATEILGAQPMPSGPPGKPGHGEVYPGVQCPVCNGPVVVRTGIAKGGKNPGKPYYILDCAADKNHEGASKAWKFAQNPR